MGSGIADADEAFAFLRRLLRTGEDAADAHPELVGVAGVSERLFERNQTGLVEVKERLIEGLHAILSITGGDGLAYLRGLLFVDDEVAYEACRDHNLDGGHASCAARGPHQPHGDDGLENAGE